MDNFAIAGLGNPGKEYERTRHNVGFLAVDYLSNSLGLEKFSLWKKEVEFSCGTFAGKKIWLLKPLLYMNNSGVPLKRFLDFHKIDYLNLLIIFDDISLDFGNIRIRKCGSAGGHNGVKSIIEHFSTDCIKRIKIGVGPILDKSDLKDFVLGNFDRQQWDAINTVLEKSSMACKKILEEGIEKAMNSFN